VASRRDFFKSFAKPLRQTTEESLLLVRPPYGSLESLFQSECPACENKACVTSCDEKIIFIADDGTPTLTFEKNGCTFCEDCAKACEPNVLSLEKPAATNPRQRHRHTGQRRRGGRLLRQPRLRQPGWRLGVAAIGVDGFPRRVAATPSGVAGQASRRQRSAPSAALVRLVAQPG